MKKLILLTLFIGFEINAYPQKIDLPLKDSIVIYEDVVKLSDTTIKKNFLFSAAKAWFANSFNDSKSVLRDQDLDAGRIIGKGTGNGYSFTIEIVVKDGKYRYRIYDLERYEPNNNNFLIKSISIAYSRYLHDNPPRLLFESKKGAMKAYDHIFFVLNEDIQKTIFSLKSSMGKVKSDDF